MIRYDTVYYMYSKKLTSSNVTYWTGRRANGDSEIDYSQATCILARYESKR